MIANGIQIPITVLNIFAEYTVFPTFLNQPLLFAVAITNNTFPEQKL